MNILTSGEAVSILNLDEGALFPQLDILLPAVDDFIKTATGKDWTADPVIDPLAKFVATVILTRWFEDPGLIGASPDKSVIALMGQLQAKAREV